MSASQQTEYNLSPFVREVKILAETEKIWILYDLDNNVALDFDEVEMFLKEMAYLDLAISDEKLKELFENIDIDGSRTISKDEMHAFIGSVLDE